MKVLFDKIAVITAPTPDRIGSLYVPQSSDDGQIVLGVVTSVGPDAAGLVKIDDQIYFNRFTSSKIKIDGTEYYVLKTSEVVAVK